MSEREDSSARKQRFKGRKQLARVSNSAGRSHQSGLSSTTSRQALTPARLQAWLRGGQPRGKEPDNVFQGLEGGHHWLAWPAGFLGCLFIGICPIFCTFLGFFAASGFSLDPDRFARLPGWLLGGITLLSIIGTVVCLGLVVLWLPQWRYTYKQSKLRASGVQAMAEIRAIHWKLVHTTRGGGRYSVGYPADVLNIQLDLSWSHPSTAVFCSGRVLYEIVDNVSKHEHHIEDFCRAYHLNSQVPVLFLSDRPTYFLPLIPYRPRLYATI